VLTGLAARWARLGIDASWLEQARDIALERLRGGQACSRAEMVATWRDAGIDMTGQRAYHAVWYLAQTGTLVQGPTRDDDHLLVLLDEWVPDPLRLDRDEALARLGRRYVQARGPVRVRDLMHWTRLGKRDCTAALNTSSDSVQVVMPDGEPGWMLRKHLETFDPDAPLARASTVALPAFDEHLLGHAVRDEVLSPKHANLVDPARNGVFRATIAVGGVTVATWSRAPRTASVRVAVSPFGAMSARRLCASAAAIQRWGDFVGRATTAQLASGA
jgi:hypothetical protein